MCLPAPKVAASARELPTGVAAAAVRSPRESRHGRSLRPVREVVRNESGVIVLERLKQRNVILARFAGRALGGRARPDRNNASRVLRDRAPGGRAQGGRAGGEAAVVAAVVGEKWSGIVVARAEQRGGKRKTAVEARAGSPVQTGDVAALP